MAARRFIFVIFLWMQTTAMTWAQTISDCAGAITLCGDLYTETEATLNTGTVYEYTGMCNANLEQSSVWYTFTVQADGLLSFIIDPLNPMDDYDWGLFNITTGGCEGIGSQLLSPEVGCNSYGVAPPQPNGATGISTANGGTGNSNGPGNFNGPPFNADLPVQAGEVYALVVMNWTNSLDGYQIDFGQSTAGLYDDTSPLPDSVTVNCELNTFELWLDEFVQTATVEPGDFMLEGPTGTVHSFQNIVTLDDQNGMVSHLQLTLADPIEWSGLYQLTITDVAGSVSDACGNLGEGSIGIELTVLEPPLGWDETTILVCPDDVALLSVDGVVQQPSNTAYTYLWSYDMAGAPVVGTGPILESMGDGYYEVVISTAPSCYSATGAFQVITEECSLTLPNVISPMNGDALNNAFVVDGLDSYPGSSIRIYNRWGVEVFASENFGATAGWDPAPEEATEGTYFYELRIFRGDDEITILSESGEVTYEQNGDPYVTITGSFALLR